MKHKLYRACHQLPPNLLLRGVIGGPQVGGGGFADIFQGSYEGNDVALKRPRVYGAGNQDKVKQQVILLVGTMNPSHADPCAQTDSS
jgi:hypothetical protein